MTTGPTGDPDDQPYPRRTDCRAGGRCDGSGWVQVTEAGAAARFPDPPPLPLDASDAEMADAEREGRRHAVLRAEAARAFYPCKECSPNVFYRWAGGHYAPNHTCPECHAMRAPMKVRRT